MWLRAGLLTVSLLALSRLAGVIRESIVAASFGISAQADLAVVLMGLPDWIAGALGAGVVTYVLIPQWAGARPASANALTQRVASVLMTFGVVLGLSMWAYPLSWLGVLVPNVAVADWPQGVRGMQINGLALVFALWAVLANAKLLSATDLVGLHTSGLFVTGVLIAALAWASSRIDGLALTWLSIAVVVGHASRAAWVTWRWWRLDHSSVPLSSRPLDQSHVEIKVRPQDWLVAGIAVALPYLFPLIARSAITGASDGAVSGFAFAWKLVELPLTLVLQWVGLLALPGLARAWASGDKAKEVALFRKACFLSVTLACTACCALVIGRDAWAQLLFGWGKMTPQELGWVGGLAAWGGLSLVPQALLSVLMARFAAARRLDHVAVAAVMGLCVLCVTIALTPLVPDWVPAGVMLQLLLAYSACSLYLMTRLDSKLLNALPWRPMVIFGLALLIAGVVVSFLLKSTANVWVHAAASLTVATGAMLGLCLFNAEFRSLLRR